MVKIAPGRTLPDWVIRGLKAGGVYQRTVNGRVIVQRKPIGYKPTLTPALKNTHEGMKKLATAHKEAIWTDRVLAEAMAKGTQLTWRDVLSMAYTGRIAEIDGVFPGMEYPDLDLIGKTVGSILYRDEGAWVLLTPSQNGYILTLHDGLPRWQVPQSVQGGDITTDLTFSGSKVYVGGTVLRGWLSDQTFTPQEHELWRWRVVLPVGSNVQAGGMAVYCQAIDSGYYVQATRDEGSFNLYRFQGGSFTLITQIFQPIGNHVGTKFFDMRIGWSATAGWHAILVDGLPMTSAGNDSSHDLIGRTCVVAAITPDTTNANIHGGMGRIYPTET